MSVVNKGGYKTTTPPQSMECAMKQAVCILWEHTLGTFSMTVASMRWIRWLHALTKKKVFPRAKKDTFNCLDGT